MITLEKLSKSGPDFPDSSLNPTEKFWQSQRSTKPSSKKGRGLAEHNALGSRIFLFVRKSGLVAGKGAPFIYCGAVNYLSHTGSEPMSVKFALETPLSAEVAAAFGIQS